MPKQNKPVKFDFQSSCQRMLLRLGAKPGGRYDMMLPTVAGPMHCSAKEDWLACMFEDVKRAREVITCGAFNHFSGKWNWHYTKPAEAGLLNLYKQLCTVVALPEGAEALQQQHDDCVAKLPPLASLNPRFNTRLTYMYRDGDNDKISRSVVFSGGSRWVSYLRPLLIAFGCPGEQLAFVPGQVGLSDLQDGFEGCESRWDPERDHAIHDVIGLEPVIEHLGADADPQGRSIHDFVEAVCQHVALCGWDPNYRPPFFARMHERYELYVAQQSRQIAMNL